MGEKGSSGCDAAADAAARPSSSSSSSSSAARPLQGPFPPGRKGWELWRTRFVLDERYTPIKVRKEERERRKRKENLVDADW